MTSRSRAINDLYDSLSDAVLDELAQYEQAVTVPQGTRLLQHGICPDRLIILHSGSAEISVVVAGKASRLDVANAGKVFGLPSIIAGTPPDTNVICLEQCEVVFVPKSAFLDVLRRNPQMYLAVAKVLSADLQEAHGFLRHNGRRTAIRRSRGPLSNK